MADDSGAGRGHDQRPSVRMVQTEDMEVPMVEVMLPSPAPVLILGVDHARQLGRALVACAKGWATEIWL